MGKSQICGVTLSKLIQLFIWTLKASNQATNLYECFTSVSKAISLCITNDLKNEPLKANENSVSCFELPEIQCIELESVGFCTVWWSWDLITTSNRTVLGLILYQSFLCVSKNVHCKKFCRKFQVLDQRKVDSNKRNGIFNGKLTFQSYSLMSLEIKRKFYFTWFVPCSSNFYILASTNAGN